MAVLGCLLITYILAVGDVPVLAYLIGPELLAMYGILWSTEFFRQRFFLDPKHERGIHWRGWLLRYAKWAQVLQGFVEVLLNRQVPYTLTPKQRSSGRRRLLLWPHLLAGIMITGAWIMGMARGPIEYPSLHVWAALLVTVLLALVATELRRFPDAYDRALQLEAGVGGHVSAVAPAGAGFAVSPD